MGGTGGPRLSGIQKQVLSMYRQFLRAARSKSPEDRSQIELIVSQEFRRNAKLVDRKNFVYIEYLLRRARNNLINSSVLILSVCQPSRSQDLRLIKIRWLQGFLGTVQEP